MRKLRISILLGVLAAAGFFALYKPQEMHHWIYGLLGQELVQALNQFAEPSPGPAVQGSTDNLPAPKPTSANRLYRQMQTENQLRPDRRFVRAAEFLQRLVSGKPSPSSEVGWNGTHWTVSIDGVNVGALTAFPDYLQASSFLDAWLQRLSERTDSRIEAAPSGVSHRIKAGVDGFNPRFLTANLVELNRRWQAGNRNGILLHQAVINLTRLALVSTGSLRFSDDLYAHSLAAIALARHVNPEVDYSEYQSQIAYAMGYEANAKKLGAGLPDANLWRIYLFRQDSRLVSELSDNPGRGESHYYLLRRLASEGLAQEWYRYIARVYRNEYAPFHALMTGYRLRDTRVFRYLSNTIPLVVVEYAGGTPVWKQMSDRLVPLLPEAYAEVLDTLARILLELTKPGFGELYRQFNENLDNNGALYIGPFMDTESWRRLQQSFFTTSIYRHGLYLVDTLEDRPGSLQLAGELSRVDSAEAKLLGNYFGLLARGIESPSSTREVVPLIDRVKVLGPDPMFRLFREIRNNYSYGSPRVKTLIRGIIDVMDSRIDNRYDYANVIHKNLLNLRAANTAFESIVRDSPESSASVDVWLARYFGRHDEILRLIHEQSRSHDDLIKMLQLLKPELIDELGAERLLTPLITKYPSSWRLRRFYIDALERAGRYPDLRRQVEEWAQLVGQSAHRNIRFKSRVIIARSYRLEGDYRRAMEALQETLIDGYGWGYYEATEIAIAQGQSARAVKIAERVRSDFPRSRYSMENLLRAYWHHGNYADAARLVEAGQPYSSDTWRWTLGKIFADVYAGQSDAGLEAFEALLKVNIEHIKLSNLALMAHKSGNYQLAFEASNRLLYPGAGILVFKLDAYRSLKSWQGEEKALAWFREQVPAGWANRSSEMIMNSRHYELLWDFIEQPEVGEHPYGVWLIRAAAQVMDGKHDSRRVARLAEYYASPEHATYYDNLGRIALNIDSGEDLLDSEFNLLKVGEVAYYKGIQEYGKGNYYDAADWFAVVVETGVARNAEYKWAHGLLDTWMRRSTDLGLQPGVAAKNQGSAD